MLSGSGGVYAGSLSTVRNVSWVCVHVGMFGHFGTESRKLNLGTCISYVGTHIYKYVDMSIYVQTYAYMYSTYISP